MGAVVLLGLVALAVVALIAWPLVRSPVEAVETRAPATDPELRDALDRSLRAIREIEFDHRAGNLSDEDFAELDAAERARAAELLRRRDRLG